MNRTGLVALLGAAMLCAAPAYATELVTNGNFEADTAAGAITGWTVSGDGIADDQVFFNSPTHDVVFTATGVSFLTGDSGDPDPGVLSQGLTSPRRASKLSGELPVAQYERLVPGHLQCVVRRVFPILLRT